MTRIAGGRWRLLVHDYLGRQKDSPIRYGTSHHVQSYSDGVAGEHSTKRVLPDTEFDELVVGRWIHIEQMDTGRWWMNVGGVTLWVTADREGRPRRVDVYGPGDYAEPVDGVTYECTWSTP